MQPRPFKQIDVFSDRPGDGNPVAVVLQAEDLSDADMRRFAAWMNLSETTFLLPPTEAGRANGADYRLRIFSPQGELPFAGHPTLGTCHAWLQAGNTPRQQGLVVQECALGLVRIRREDHTLAFAAPPLTRSAPSPALVPLIASALGVRPAQILGTQLLDNGPVWLGMLLDSADTVLGLQPDHARLMDLGQSVGVVHVGKEASDASRPGVVVRAFAAPMGNREDPVTGSLNASLAEWLIAEGLAPHHYQVAQGECLGRAGRVHIRQDDHQVWVGGRSVTCIEGTVLL
ncbi:PhzF family phenazine biosynthesis protein [Acidovorax soli]|uniref:PhzF family phenazine biosynthesis protein n=1 Tax=Acidovorax soli TaxID=592050 RepID=A0A7X0PH40_9BURK|nr:PhzF family phenazine biosynthesis protein [Acidovorax soli]MBB6561457.1 PhzF family phenazine biosynthesis protein [Acidovorax soli]